MNLTTGLHVELKKCFGIGSLTASFGFKQSNVSVVYAANGVMKSSFARTFDCIARGKRSEIVDRLDGQKGSAKVLIDGVELDSRKHLNIAVFSGDDYVDAGASISAFLSDRETKKSYEDAICHIKFVYGRFVSSLVQALAVTSCEQLLMALLHADENSVYLKLFELKDEIEKLHEGTCDILYGEVFDDNGDVDRFVETNGTLLSRWAEAYRRAISRSRLLGIARTGAFADYEALSLVKVLGADSFFDVGHKIQLRTGKTYFKSQEFERAVTKARDRVQKHLLKSSEWKDILKKIDANKSLRRFKQFLLSHPHDINWTDGPALIKKQFLLRAIKATGIAYAEYITCYEKYRNVIEAACKKTERAREQWESAITEYRLRFNPPFRVSIENSEAVFVGAASGARMRFHYGDKELAEGPLRDILSVGEARVLKLLQFVFDLKDRACVAQRNKQRQIVVLDDIVDSFDYRHKYALVEYLKDLSNNPYLWFVVLTHNFDFYRLVATRLGVGRGSDASFAMRTQDGVQLIRGEYQKNVLSFWANSDAPSLSVLLAMIPLSRNLCELRYGEASLEYETLTACLHARVGARCIEQVTCGNVLRLYSKLFARCVSNTSRWSDRFRGKLVTILFDEADRIARSADQCDVHIEYKIVLAMATRIRVEQWLFRELKLNAPYEKDQTGKMIQEFKDRFGESRGESVALLNEVSVVTPEYIHLNAFMYESLIDTGMSELRKLYMDVSKLV